MENYHTDRRRLSNQIYFIKVRCFNTHLSIKTYLSLVNTENLCTVTKHTYEVETLVVQECNFTAR